MVHMETIEGNDKMSQCLLLGLVCLCLKSTTRSDRKGDFIAELWKCLLGSIIAQCLSVKTVKQMKVIKNSYLYITIFPKHK